MHFSNLEPKCILHLHYQIVPTTMEKNHNIVSIYFIGASGHYIDLGPNIVGLDKKNRVNCLIYLQIQNYRTLNYC